MCLQSSAQIGGAFCLHWERALGEHVTRRLPDRTLSLAWSPRSNNKPFHSLWDHDSTKFQRNDDKKALASILSSLWDLVASCPQRACTGRIQAACRRSSVSALRARTRERSQIESLGKNY
jgi:hypothetical protein